MGGEAAFPSGESKANDVSKASPLALKGGREGECQGVGGEAAFPSGESEANDGREVPGRLYTANGKR